MVKPRAIKRIFFYECQEVFPRRRLTRFETPFSIITSHSRLSLGKVRQDMCHAFFSFRCAIPTIDQLNATDSIFFMEGKFWTRQPPNTSNLEFSITSDLNPSFIRIVSPQQKNWELENRKLSQIPVFLRERELLDMDLSTHT